MLVTINKYDVRKNINYLECISKVYDIVNADKVPLKTNEVPVAPTFKLSLICDRFTYNNGTTTVD